MTGHSTPPETPAHGVLRAAYQPSVEGITARPPNDPYHDSKGAILWRQACAAAATGGSTEGTHLPSAPGWDAGP